MPVPIQTMGADVSLRHGVIVSAQWAPPVPGEPPVLLDYDIVYQWTKGSGLNEQSTFKDIQILCARVYKATTNGRGLCLGVDWDKTTAFWGRRTTSTMLALFVGYLLRTIELRGVIPVLLSPSEVRTRLKLPHNLPKEDLWKAFRGIRIKKQRDAWGASDLRDALILSYIVARGEALDAAKEAGQARLSL